MKDNDKDALYIAICTFTWGYLATLIYLVVHCPISALLNFICGLLVLNLCLSI